MKTMSAASFPQPSGYMRPEIFGHQKCNPAEVGDDHAAHHDVVEVSDDEVSVGDVDVDAEAAEEEAGESADREEADEAEGIEHRGLIGDGALVHGGGPVEDFDRRGESDEVASRARR